MTIDQLLELARSLATPTPAPAADWFRLARGVIELLDRGDPCGWPKPTGKNGIVSWEGLELIPTDEAHDIAVMLLRAVDDSRG